MRTFKIISSLLAVGLAVTSTQAGFVSVNMSFKVSGSSNYGSGGNAGSFSTTNAADLGSGYVLAENAFIPGGNPDGSVSPYAGGSSSWTADGNSGEVYIDWGWMADGANAINTDLAGPNWQYTFVADFDGKFIMDFNVAGSGFGLNGISLGHNFDTGSGAPVLNAFDPTDSGTFTGNVTAGQAYVVSLMNGGNIAGNNFSAGGDASGHFEWRIERAAGVPDAGSTSLLLTLAGLSLAWFGGRHGRRSLARS